MRKTLVAIIFVVASFGLANAQPKAEQSARVLIVPNEYMTLFESFRGWKSEHEAQSERHANSIENWATHALYEAGKVRMTAIRNWLFTRGEDRIRELAMSYKDQLVEIFGKQFNTRGMHTVFSQSYTGDTDTLYRLWYDCTAKLNVPDLDRLIGNRVLSTVNSWVDEDFEVLIAGDCKSDFQTLSAHYGLDRLTPDDLTSIGFLSRRHAANKLSSRFVSAEFLRKLVHDIFDPDEK